MCSDCKPTAKDNLSGELIQSSGAEGALLGNTAISRQYYSNLCNCYSKNPEKLSLAEQLRSLGYPETGIVSMLRCGKPTGFKLIRECECHTAVLDVNWRCNLRTCPTCAGIRKNRLRSRFLPILKSVPVGRNQGTFRFLTISPLNYDSFEEGFNDIQRMFRKLVRTDLWKAVVKGYIYVVEAKNDRCKGWNVHIHAILYGGSLSNRVKGICHACGKHELKYNKYSRTYVCASSRCHSSDVEKTGDSELVELIKKCGNGREVNVMINAVYEQKTNSGTYNVSMSRKPEFALNYLLKYVSANKDDFKDLVSKAEYIKGTYKHHLINVGGIFRKMKIKSIKSMPCTCPVCKTEIKFTFDPELSRLLTELQEPNPPPDIWNDRT